MNKVLVTVFLPIIGESYEVWIPTSKSVYQVILLLIKGIADLSEQNYSVNKIPVLYNKLTGKKYDLNSKIKDTDIKNGVELILLLV